MSDNKTSVVCPRCKETAGGLWCDCKTERSLEQRALAAGLRWTQPTHEVSHIRVDLTDFWGESHGQVWWPNWSGGTIRCTPNDKAYDTVRQAQKAVLQAWAAEQDKQAGCHDD